MASNEGRGDFCTAITSFISWLAGLLASLFKRSRPLEELPIVMSGSQQTMALLEAFRAEDQGITVQIGATQSSHLLSAHPHVRRHLPVGPSQDPPIEKRFIRSPSSPMKTKSFSSTPVAREKPLSNYPTAFRWTAPVTQPDDDNWESVRDTCPLGDDDKVHSGIGNLGQRRGFKGKPLMVSKWSRSSTFLSLPKGLNFSPRSSSMNSLDGAFSSMSPRTPLEAVANRMRSVSVSVVSWSSGVKTPVPEVSQDLQDLYDASDPFASHGDTFFVLMHDVDTLPTPDLCQFGFYRQRGMTRKQSCIVKNALLQAALHPAFTNARMKTTIYDMSTADVVPVRVTVPTARNTVSASLDVPQRGPDVVNGIIAVTSPTIVLTAPPSPTIQEVDNDETKLADELPVSDDTHELPDNGQLISEEKIPKPGSKEENKASRLALAEIRNTVLPPERNQHDVSGLSTHPTPVLSVSPATDCLGDNGLANAQLPTFQYAEFPQVIYETCASPCDDDIAAVPFPGGVDTLTPCWPLSATQRRSSLRPLVLPARVASRLSARIAPVPAEDDAGRLHALEGIIALLDVGLTTQEV